MKVVINGYSKVVGINTDEKIEAELLTRFTEKEDLILFPWYSCNLENFIGEGDKGSNNWNEFVKEHTVLKSKGDILDWELEEDEFILWYSPNSREELMRIIKFEWLCYTCCIVPKGKEIKDYKYILEMYEHDIYEGEEYRSLFITEKEKQSFENKVVPTIQPMIEEYNRLYSYKHNTAYYFEE